MRRTRYGEFQLFVNVVTANGQWAEPRPLTQLGDDARLAVLTSCADLRYGERPALPSREAAGDARVAVGRHEWPASGSVFGKRASDVG
jgi:hypothetical protein